MKLCRIYTWLESIHFLLWRKNFTTKCWNCFLFSSWFGGLAVWCGVSQGVLLWYSRGRSRAGRQLPVGLVALLPGLADVGWSKGGGCAGTPLSHRGLDPPGLRLVQMGAAVSDRARKRGRRRWGEKLPVLWGLFSETAQCHFCHFPSAKASRSADPHSRMSRDSSCLTGGATKRYRHFHNLRHGSNVCEFIIVISGVTINWILICYHDYCSCLMNIIISSHLQSIPLPNVTASFLPLSPNISSISLFWSALCTCPCAVHTNLQHLVNYLDLGKS